MPNSVTRSDAGTNEPEIEITPECIILRRPRCCHHMTLLEIADRLSNARIPFDDEDTSATSAYISALAEVAEAIRSAVRRASQRPNEV
jgi:hypothetical protein